ncbi:hypothetical protein NESM_000427300 [Novymonas esmeraldas]|uniref:RING-type domain-containing protein n=1 Tax=Novymonas esmeraldas TaxID=1808958 RepID=A0AAW0EMU4_9TRYP
MSTSPPSVTPAGATASASGGGVCDCCECGVVVGTEGRLRGCLLLPCQHILHMGCVEFIRRRGKVLLGMDSADLPHEESEAGAAAANGLSVCPACLTPITRIVPLYVRSADDTDQQRPSSQPVTAADSAAVEAEYTRVHSAQRQVLHRLRGLCDQRRRVTELTHACASLHEQRARCLAEVEREERCYPGLAPSGGADAHGRPSSSPAAPHAAGALAVEHMGVTELELYMAQTTPRLLRMQADLRRERHAAERRSRRLSALRTHYHTAKELRAIDDAIAHREAATHRPPAAPSPPTPSRPRATAGTDAPPGRLHGSTSGTAAPAAVVSRKRHRGGGGTAIDVDVEALPLEVVEVHSCGDSDADTSADAPVLDVDGGTESDAEVEDGDGGSGGVELVPITVDGSTADENAYEAPYLIPCYVRPATGSPATVPKTSATATTITHAHLRLLPRREDRLWQPSLQF